nr:RNA-directed DNA polymerase, eukaryota [Tanacetum cinerariifolium]
MRDLDIDKKLDQGGYNDETLNERSTLVNDLHDIKSLEALEIAQKAIVLWSIEGHENTKYCHGILNNKRSQLAIRGIFVDGEWRTDQYKVWSKVRVLCGMDSIPPRLIDVTNLINRISKGKMATLSPDQIIDVIISMVRLKFGTFKFKKMSTRSRLLLDQRKIPSSCIAHDGTSSWINGCLNSAMGSILVNGSPTMEFQFHKGLKINVYKNKLMGIGINTREVKCATRLVGFSTFITPFNYLEVKVGDVMSRIKSWDEVISKLSSRLSKWKLKTLSIRGRLSLLKSVLNFIHLYHVSIFKVSIGILNKIKSICRKNFFGSEGLERKMALIDWKSILASKKNGGLRVSSFFAVNRVLLFK